MKLKRHMDTQTHKSKLILVENQEHSAMKSHDARIEKEAAMRCARICYLLLKKGRPFTDYPDLVATIVQGGTFMGDVNHSKRFPHEKCHKSHIILGIFG